jgi:hypothetical protein
MVQVDHMFGLGSPISIFLTTRGDIYKVRLHYSFFYSYYYSYYYSSYDYAYNLRPHHLPDDARRPLHTHKKKDSWSQEATNFFFPGGARFFNIFDPTDPVAFRFVGRSVGI